MKKYILLLCFVTFWNFASGQQKQIDSLSKIINSSEEKDKISALLQLADIHLNNNPKKSIFYSELALKKSKATNDIENTFTATEKIGHAYLLLGNIELAYDYYNIILKEVPPISNPKFSRELLTRKGEIYENLGEFDKAIICYQYSLKIAEKTNDSLSIAQSLNDIGYIFFLMQEFTTANNYFKQSLADFIKLNNLQGISDSYNRIGIIYGITNKNDSALICFNKALNIKRKINATDKIVVMLENIGEVYLQKDQPDSSLVYFNEAYNILDNQNAIYEMAYLQNYLSKAYLLKKEYNKAYETLNKAAKLAINLKYWYVSEIYATYSDYYLKINDYKNAHMYLKLHYTVKDSIFNIKKKHKISELQVKYETNVKEKQIISLNKEKELIQINLKKKNIIILLSIFGIIIITIFSFIIYSALRIKNKTNNILNLKNIEIERQRHEISLKNDVLEKQKEEIITQKESLEDTNAELGKINVYLEKLSNRNVHTDLAIIIATDKCKVESVNLGFFNMFGYSSAEFSDLFPSLKNWFDDEAAEQINVAIKTKDSVNIETIHKTKSELTVFVQTTIIPITNISGNIIKILVIETEITKF